MSAIVTHPATSQRMSLTTLSPVQELECPSDDNSDAQSDAGAATGESINDPFVGISAEILSIVVDSGDELSIDEENSSENEEGYETDLEFNADKWLYPEKYDHDTTGKNIYTRVCEEVGTVPATTFLRSIQSTEIIMPFRNIGTAGAKAVSVPLERNATIEKLNLRDNSIGEEGARCLTKFMKENVFITDLDLSENEIGTGGARHICAMLVRNSNILRLNLSGNDIGDGVAEHFAKVLTKNVGLKELTLSHNRFEDPGAEHLRAALAENDSLDGLDLSWNNFHPRGGISLAQGLQENIGLKRFNFSMNGLGKDGAEAMGKALRVNRTLLELDISFCRISLEGAAHIAYGLQTNETLTTLKMGSNPFGAEGALVVLTSIQKHDHCALKLLDLTNVMVNENFQTMEDSLAMSRGLTVIHDGVVRNRRGNWREEYDPKKALERDPMMKLKAFMAKSKFRMIDLFKEFDKDGSMSVTKDEFFKGLKKIGIDLTAYQIKSLMHRMDRDKDGKIQYEEMLHIDNDFRQKKIHLQTENGTDKHPKPAKDSAEALLKDVMQL